MVSQQNNEIEKQTITQKNFIGMLAWFIYLFSVDLLLLLRLPADIVGQPIIPMKKVFYAETDAHLTMHQRG